MAGKKYNPDIHNRRSIRLPEYDYSHPGAYFVTICIKNRQCLFGKIKDGKMILNETGKLIENQWHALQKRFKNIKLDAYIVMPNHFHGIIILIDQRRDESCIHPDKKSLLNPQGVDRDESCIHPDKNYY